MLTWNVNRHVKKINGIDFIETIPEYYLTFLSETWLSNQHTINLDIKGFENIQIYGKKLAELRKDGIVVDELFISGANLKKILVVETREEGIKDKNNLFHFEEDVFICHAYISPVCSTVLNDRDLIFLRK